MKCRFFTIKIKIKLNIISSSSVTEIYGIYDYGRFFKYNRNGVQKFELFFFFYDFDVFIVIT